MATSATPSDRDWFDANFRQVLGIAGAADAVRPLSAPQVLTAIGKRFVRQVEPGSNRVTFARNGEALQLMNDPAEVDPLIATFAASQLGGPRAALATIEADLCVPGGCEGDAGRALATIRDTLDMLIDVSARRDGTFRARLLISQLIGVRRVPVGNANIPATIEFGLVLCLRNRVAEGHRRSPSFAREQALNILSLAIDAIRSFGAELGNRTRARRRPLHDVVETLHRCALHISDRVREIRWTLAELGIGQCELERAGRDRNQGEDQRRRLPTLDGVQITIPDLFSALETQPQQWSRLMDGATPDSQAAIAASVRALAEAVDYLDPSAFAELFNVGADAGDRLVAAWQRFGAYTSAVLEDLETSLASPLAAAAPAAARSDDEEALIEAPEEEQQPLQE